MKAFAFGSTTLDTGSIRVNNFCSRDIRPWQHSSLEKSEVTFLSFTDCSASESLLLNRQTRVATLPDIDNKQLSCDNMS